MERTPEITDDTTSFYSEGSELSSNSDYRPHEKCRKRKNLRRKRSKYQNISNDLRASLIQLVTEENQKIKPTAKKLGINYSTAKSILQIYRKEGRTDKKLLFRPAGEEDESTQGSSQENVHKVQTRHSDQNMDVEKGQQAKTKEEPRYSLRKTDKTEEKKATIEHSKPDYSDIEPPMLKKVRKDSQEATGFRSPLSFDSEGISRNNSREEGSCSANTLQSFIRDNNIRSPIPIYRNSQKAQNVGFKPVSGSIRIPTATYPTMQRHDLSAVLMNHAQNASQQQAIPFNLLNLEISRYLLQQQQQQQNQQLQNSRMALLSAQNANTLGNTIFNPAIKHMSQFLPNGFPFNFQIKM